MIKKRRGLGPRYWGKSWPLLKGEMGSLLPRNNICSHSKRKSVLTQETRKWVVGGDWRVSHLGARRKNMPRQEQKRKKTGPEKRISTSKDWERY